MRAPDSIHYLHRPGDGAHELPVRCLIEGRLVPLSSWGCVMLLFLCWAQQRGYDAVEIFARACPQRPPLRPDQLLFFRAWTSVPDPVELAPLCADLRAVGEAGLVRVLLEIGSCAWHPPAAYTHWVVSESGVLVGEARDLDPPRQADEHGQHFCYVRLFSMPEMAEWGYTCATHLKPKDLG